MILTLLSEPYIRKTLEQAILRFIVVEKKYKYWLRKIFPCCKDLMIFPGLAFSFVLNFV